MGLKNLTIIHKKGDELAGAIIDETLEAEEDVSTADLSNVVVLASKETIDSEVFNLFRSDIKTKRAFLAAVDSSELKEAYAEHGETFDKQLDAKISEMLCLTLELAAGKTAPISDVPWLEIEYDEVLRIVTFLPRAKPIDYDKLQERYDRKKLALQAV